MLIRTMNGTLTHNGPGLCDGGEIEAEKLNLLLLFNQGTNVEFCTKAPLLQNRCYLPFICQL
jgi:hypothetical protein